MNSRARLFILNSILIAILFCSVSTTTAYTTRDWNVGDELYFDYLISQKEIYVNEAEKIRDTVTYSSSFENKYVITDIIELSKEIFVNLSIPMEVEPYPLNWTYTANYSSNVLVDYLFSFEYHWDDVANQSRLTSFHMLGDIFLIVVDPDWDLFNQGLANIGDLDRIIDTVTYNSTTLNITFGDFLDSVPSYQFTGIQGFPGSSISPSTTHEWKFEFNLGNVIYQREYDPVFFEWIFTPYSNYNASTIIQFTEGGTLIESTYFDEKIVEEVDEEPLRLESVISYYNKDLRTSNTSISFNSILVTIIAIPLSIFGLKRKKK